MNKDNKINIEQVDVFKYINYILKNKRSIFVAAIIAVATGLLISKQPKMYVSNSSVLINTASSFDSMLNSSNLNSIADIVGLKQSNKNNELIIARIKSRDFIVDYLKKNNFTKIVYDNYWNEKTNSWKTTNKKFLVFNAPVSTPSPYQLHKQFISKHLNIEQDQRTDILTLSIHAQSPVLAQKMCSQLIKAINNVIGKEQILQLEQSLEYLRSATKIEQSIEIQKALYSIIEKQTQQLILLKINNNDIIKVLDKPSFIEDSQNISLPATLSVCTILFILIWFIFGSLSYIISQQKNV